MDAIERHNSLITSLTDVLPPGQPAEDRWLSLAESSSLLAAARVQLRATFGSLYG